MRLYAKKEQSRGFQCHPGTLVPGTVVAESITHPLALAVLLSLLFPLQYRSPRGRVPRARRLARRPSRVEHCTGPEGPRLPEHSARPLIPIKNEGEGTFCGLPKNATRKIKLKGPWSTHGHAVPLNTGLWSVVGLSPGKAGKRNFLCTGPRRALPNFSPPRSQITSPPRPHGPCESNALYFSPSLMAPCPQAALL